MANYAVHSELWGYRFERQDRQEFEVVRARTFPAQFPGTRAVVEALWRGDQTYAGQDWSDEERDVNRPNCDEVVKVVVVGEIFDKFPVRNLGLINVDGVEFSPYRHVTVETHHDTRVVVARPAVSDGPPKLYMLGYRQNGLCGLLALGPGDEEDIVFYPEWVRGTETWDAREKDNKLGTAARRWDVWMGNVSAFIRAHRSHLLDEHLECPGAVRAIFDSAVPTWDRSMSYACLQACQGTWMPNHPILRIHPDGRYTAVSDQDQAEYDAGGNVVLCVAFGTVQNPDLCRITTGRLAELARGVRMTFPDDAVRELIPVPNHWHIITQFCTLANVLWGTREVPDDLLGKVIIAALAHGQAASLAPPSGQSKRKHERITM